MSLLLPLAFALLLLLTLLQSRRPLHGKTWLFLRSLLPSWRFFEDIEAGPELSFRVTVNGHAPGLWMLAWEPPTQRHHLVLNAGGNLKLAYQSLVEQLLSDLDGTRMDVAPSLTSYQLVQRLIEQRAAELGLATPDARYVFRLRSGDESEPSDFESEEHGF